MNRNRTLFLVIFIVFVQAVSGQDYFTQGAAPNLHLTHKVAAKETWYSIGRTYNLTPQEIVSFNKLSISQPLEIGQVVKIPLNADNFSQNDSKSAGEVLIPVYHLVQEKEWMYRISVNHNKVPIEKLEKWNSISRDDAKAGSKLIVGFLKVKEENASLAARNAGTVRPQTDASQTVAKNEPVKTVPEVKKTETVVAQTGTGTSTGGGGYFKVQFEGNNKNYSGVSGIFKSTSGWNDGKYYALINNVTVGTIVRINFPQTNKSIYAKVLGELPDMKESAGLALRISDAAAKELGAVSSKFSVQIFY